MGAHSPRLKDIGLSIIASLLATLIPGAASAQNFVRVEDQAGLAHVTNNNGVAVADYDRDGDLDIFVTGFLNFNFSDSTTWNRLLKNNGDATFKDVTLEAGLGNQFVNTGILAARGEKMGASWGDYDNDGYPDLFLTNSREDQLYHNEGNGTFIDVTLLAGVIGCHECYSSSGLWWDFDRDGDLDLYVSIINGDNIMYKNMGAGVFQDVTSQLNLAGDGITWSSVAVDVNNDGFLDLYNANDEQENLLFLNRPGKSFLESGYLYGVNNKAASMGITIGDYNNDGLFDFYITDIYNDRPNVLYTHLSNGGFRNDAQSQGVENTGWGWGTQFFDFDHDGDEDLYAVNGVEENQYLNGVLQTDVNNVFFKNMFMEGTGNFVDWSVQSGADGSARGRGLEVFDYDNDGDLDLLVANVLEKPYLFRNETIKNTQPESQNWIKIWLEGTTSNRDALGTTVKATINGKSYYRWHHGAAIFGQSLKPVHFGLASAKIIDELQITWPNGLIETIYNVPANQTLRLKEGDNTTVTGVRDGIHPAEVYNYPNPFDNCTTFHFKLAKPGVVDLRIFTNLGQELFQQAQTNAGSDGLEISWDGADKNGNRLPGGIYYYNADFEDHHYSGKILKLGRKN